MKNFYKIFVISILLYHVSVQSFDAIINLGGDCQVAYQLYINGLRSYALPFDTLITPFDSLKEMLKNRFEGFLTPDNFELKIDNEGTKYILDKKYGSRMIHDFKREEGFLEDYELVATKYMRRIERLIHLIHTSEYPLFIRKRITQEQAVELKDVLSILRDGKPFLLAILDGNEEFKVDLCIENVCNFYLRQPTPYTWKGDPEAWKEIFQALDLPISTAENSDDER